MSAAFAPAPRSDLFVPGNRPARSPKAFEAGAGAVVADRPVPLRANAIPARHTA